MRHDTSRASADEDARIQRAILALLLDPDAQRPWSIAEIERETEDRVATVDALAHLRAAGLVHGCGQFVTATRAAVHMDRLSL
jgi:hypothetical protein